MAPVIGALALSEERALFIIFLCISFVNRRARWAHRPRSLEAYVRRVGSRLDSIADELTYVAALVGMFQFEYHVLKPHIAILYIFIGLLVVGTLIPVVKFRVTPSFHLYSFKANALLQALFMVTLFVLGFDVYLYYFVMSFGILACLEMISVGLVLDEPISNAKDCIGCCAKKGRPIEIGSAILRPHFRNKHLSCIEASRVHPQSLTEK